jgi:hypothetical protein
LHLYSLGKEKHDIQLLKELGANQMLVRFLSSLQQELGLCRLKPKSNMKCLEDKQFTIHQPQLQYDHKENFVSNHQNIQSPANRADELLQ